MFDSIIKKRQEGDSISSGQKWWLPIILTTIFILFVLIIGTSLMFFEIYYNDKFFPGSRIGDINLSGLTKKEAFNLIEDRLLKIDNNTITIKYLDNNQEKNTIINNSINPEVGINFFNFDLYQSVYVNFNIGRSDRILSNLTNQLMIFLGKKKMLMIYKIDKDYVLKNIKNELKSIEVSEVNATPEIKCNNTCQINIYPEKDGISFDYDKAINNWEKGLAGLKNDTIKLDKVITKPIIKKNDVEVLISDLNLLFSSSNTPEFYYQEKKYQISKNDFSGMVIFSKINNKLKLSVDKLKFDNWFNKTISKDLDIEAKNAILQVNNGKITNLSTHKNGQKVDNDQAFNDLNNILNSGDFSNLKINLKVNQVLPEVSTESVNDLGIKEILGTGQSNFSGSPTNRIKNIKNGASKLHGRLIKPGEEFSLVKSLLPVDAANGYFPELVIKGNKTTPEYGGGLCQVGTTVFRAALASGLPILERQNHSYSVTYYLEDGLPGVDATIYDPKPDLRFKNDTNNYILIQSRIEGTKLYFDFWGTKDGRVANRTKPKTWGVKNPPPTKIIETTDLKPGEKKCTESSHKGISASFNYIVVYGDGKTATTTFTSVYKPWQAVCLVGSSGQSSSTTNTTTQTIDN